MHGKYLMVNKKKSSQPREYWNTDSKRSTSQTAVGDAAGASAYGRNAPLRDDGYNQKQPFQVGMERQVVYESSAYGQTLPPEQYLEGFQSATGLGRMNPLSYPMSQDITQGYLPDTGKGPKLHSSTESITNAKQCKSRSSTQSSNAQMDGPSSVSTGSPVKKKGSYKNKKLVLLEQETHYDANGEPLPRVDKYPYVPTGTAEGSARQQARSTQCSEAKSNEYVEDKTKVPTMDEHRTFTHVTPSSKVNAFDSVLHKIKDASNQFSEHKPGKHTKAEVLKASSDKAQTAAVGPMQTNGSSNDPAGDDRKGEVQRLLAGAVVTSARHSFATKLTDRVKDKKEPAAPIPQPDRAPQAPCDPLIANKKNASPSIDARPQQTKAAGGARAASSKQVSAEKKDAPRKAPSGPKQSQHVAEISQTNTKSNDQKQKACAQHKGKARKPSDASRVADQQSVVKTPASDTSRTDVKTNALVASQKALDQPKETVSLVESTRSPFSKAPNLPVLDSELALNAPLRPLSKDAGKEPISQDTAFFNSPEGVSSDASLALTPPVPTSINPTEPASSTGLLSLPATKASKSQTASSSKGVDPAHLRTKLEAKNTQSNLVIQTATAAAIGKQNAYGTPGETPSKGKQKDKKSSTIAKASTATVVHKSADTSHGKTGDDSDTNDAGKKLMIDVSLKKASPPQISKTKTSAETLDRAARSSSFRTMKGPKIPPRSSSLAQLPTPGPIMTRKKKQKTFAPVVEDKGEQDDSSSLNFDKLREEGEESVQGSEDLVYQTPPANADTQATEATASAIQDQFERPTASRDGSVSEYHTPMNSPARENRTSPDISPPTQLLFADISAATPKAPSGSKSKGKKNKRKKHRKRYTKESRDVLLDMTSSSPAQAENAYAASPGQARRQPAPETPYDFLNAGNENPASSSHTHQPGPETPHRAFSLTESQGKRNESSVSLSDTDQYHFENNYYRNNKASALQVWDENRRSHTLIPPSVAISNTTKPHDSPAFLHEDLTEWRRAEVLDRELHRAIREQVSALLSLDTSFNTNAEEEAIYSQERKNVGVKRIDRAALLHKISPLTNKFESGVSTVVEHNRMVREYLWWLPRMSKEGYEKLRRWEKLHPSTKENLLRAGFTSEHISDNGLLWECEPSTSEKVPSEEGEILISNSSSPDSSKFTPPAPRQFGSSSDPGSQRATNAAGYHFGDQFEMAENRHPRSRTTKKDEPDDGVESILHGGEPYGKQNEVRQQDKKRKGIPEAPDTEQEFASPHAAKDRSLEFETVRKLSRTLGQVQSGILMPDQRTVEVLGGTHAVNKHTQQVNEKLKAIEGEMRSENAAPASGRPMIPVFDDNVRQKIEAGNARLKDKQQKIEKEAIAARVRQLEKEAKQPKQTKKLNQADLNAVIEAPSAEQAVAETIAELLSGGIAKQAAHQMKGKMKQSSAVTESSGTLGDMFYSSLKEINDKTNLNLLADGAFSDQGAIRNRSRLTKDDLKPTEGAADTSICSTQPIYTPPTGVFGFQSPFASNNDAPSPLATKGKGSETVLEGSLCDVWVEGKQKAIPQASLPTDHIQGMPEFVFKNPRKLSFTAEVDDSTNEQSYIPGEKDSSTSQKPNELSSTAKAVSSDNKECPPPTEDESITPQNPVLSEPKAEDQQQSVPNASIPTEGFTAQVVNLEQNSDQEELSRLKENDLNTLQKPLLSGSKTEDELKSMPDVSIPTEDNTKEAKVVSPQPRRPSFTANAGSSDPVYKESPAFKESTRSTPQKSSKTSDAKVVSSDDKEFPALEDGKKFPSQKRRNRSFATSLATPDNDELSPLKDSKENAQQESREPGFTANIGSSNDKGFPSTNIKAQPTPQKFPETSYASMISKPKPGFTGANIANTNGSNDSPNRSAPKMFLRGGNSTKKRSGFKGNAKNRVVGVDRSGKPIIAAEWAPSAVGWGSGDPSSSRAKVAEGMTPAKAIGGEDEEKSPSKHVFGGGDGTVEHPPGYKRLDDTVLTEFGPFGVVVRSDRENVIGVKAAGQKKDAWQKNTSGKDAGEKHAGPKATGAQAGGIPGKAGATKGQGGDGQKKKKKKKKKKEGRGPRGGGSGAATGVV